MIGRRTFLLGGAAFPLWAQKAATDSSAPQGSTDELLSSRDPALLAWGACLAAERADRSVISNVMLLLWHEHPDVQLVAADALIRLDAEPAPELLRGVRIDGKLDPVIVLLSRNPQRYTSALMSLLDQPLDPVEWVAVTSLLCTIRPARLAARLLREWQLQITIEVRDRPGDTEQCWRGFWEPTKPARDRAGFRQFGKTSSSKVR